ncbi:hypothetical protein GW17_00019919 [Ensete ventricosum]|nr:hypothetical protein GW17_00019919 [Ensete ventricosum]
MLGDHGPYCKRLRQTHHDQHRELPDILYLDTFQKLEMTNQDLVPMTSTLTGFTGDEITPTGVVTLPMTFDDEPRTKTFMVPFMVVDLPSAYNTIIDRPTLNKLKAIVSIDHHSMKFPTSAGPGEIKSDTREAHALARLASADTPDEFSIIHGLCRLTVATVETAITTPTGESPYSLAFGTKVILPPEVVFPTLRVKNFTAEMLEAGLRENLDMLKERRAKAHLKTLHYQRAVARLYNRRVRPRPIGEGDLVLKKAEVSDPGRTCRKLVPRWEWSYRVTQVVWDEIYTLSTLEGKTLPRTWHVSNLKKFYV